MLDLRCARCGTLLVGKAGVCASCGTPFGEDGGKRRRRKLLGAAGVVAGTAVIVVLAFPELLPRSVRAAPAEPDFVSKAGPWTWGGAVPVTRAWAAPLEAGMATACRDAHAQMLRPKYMSAFIAHRFLAAEKLAAAAEGRAARWRALGADEDEMPSDPWETSSSSSPPACAGATTRSPRAPASRVTCARRKRSSACCRRSTAP